MSKGYCYRLVHRDFWDNAIPDHVIPEMLVSTLQFYSTVCVTMFSVLGSSDSRNRRLPRLSRWQRRLSPPEPQAPCAGRR